MPAITLTDALKAEYNHLFDTCQVRPNKAADIERVVEFIWNNQATYSAVSGPTDVPWYVIAVIHQMEASGNFKTHLHNGDPLTARTRQVPAGRPKTGRPPFTWQESAIDALRYDKLDQWKDWSVAGMLFKLEGYNGWGYRRNHPDVKSPYLWSYSQHYTAGKYVADGTWSQTAVSKQPGAAVILRRMAERNMVVFAPKDNSADGEAEELASVVMYNPRVWSAAAVRLQRFLNTVPGIFLKVDGYAGSATSEALRKVTGTGLLGDPADRDE